MSFDFAQSRTFAIAIILLLLASLVIWRTTISRILDLFSVISEGREWSSRLKTPEDLLEYIIAHPQDVSLVAYEIGNSNNSKKSIFYKADKKCPFSMKLHLILNSRKDAKTQRPKVNHHFIKCIVTENWYQALNCGGTAKGYALIMKKIYSSLLISQGADKIMRDYLEWQMEFAGNQQEIDTFGFKNGSLPGIITEACYFKPKQAKNARVFALFFENLPAGVWFQMLQNYVQQDFEYKLLGDESFFELVRQRLQQS